MNSILKFQALTMSAELSKLIQGLPKMGKIKIIPGGFSYVDIDDNFIHQVYPLLDYPGAVKPDYFSEENNPIGAHISICYPEECIELDSSEENKLISFSIVGLFAADLADKRYIALKVEAADLLKIRRKYGLTNKLQLAGYLIDPHITVATSNP